MQLLNFTFNVVFVAPVTIILIRLMLFQVVKLGDDLLLKMFEKEVTIKAMSQGTDDRTT